MKNSVLGTWDRSGRSRCADSQALVCIMSWEKSRMKNIYFYGKITSYILRSRLQKEDSLYAVHKGNPPFGATSKNVNDDFSMKNQRFSSMFSPTS